MLYLGNDYEASSWVWDLLSYNDSYHVTDIVKLLQNQWLHYTVYYDLTKATVQLPHDGQTNVSSGFVNNDPRW